MVIRMARPSIPPAMDIDYRIAPEALYARWDLRSNQERWALDRIGCSVADAQLTGEAAAADSQHVVVKMEDRPPRARGHIFDIVGQKGSSKEAERVAAGRRTRDTSSMRWRDG